jgi:hypothetical protein
MPAIRDWTYGFSTTGSVALTTGFMPVVQANDLVVAIVSTPVASTRSAPTGWTTLLNTTNTAQLSVWWKVAASDTEADLTGVVLGTSTTSAVHMLTIQDANITSPGNTTIFNGNVTAGYQLSVATAAKGAMPSITTTSNDSLIIYSAITSAAEIPMILEGSVTWEDGADAATHSSGFSWSYKKTAGATPSTVYYNKMGNSASILTAIAISPPLTGATVVPTYTVSDASSFIDPINGVTAYNGNGPLSTVQIAGLLGKPVPFWGNTINNRNIAITTTTVAANLDVGLNPYHSMGAWSTAALPISGTWYGTQLIPSVANKPSAIGKNILVHLRPTTPKSYQNTDSISRTGTKGLAFGVNANCAYITTANITANTMQVFTMGAGTTSANIVVGQTLLGPSQLAGGNVRITANVSDATGLKYTLTQLPITSNTLATVANLSGIVTSSTAIYHVHGNGTNLDSAQHLPVVINTNYTGNGLIQSNGNIRLGANINAFGFFLSGFSVQPSWQVGSLWQLDTQVIAGGDPTNPINMPRLVNAIGRGKERQSMELQGASQALLIQPIQLGDGAVNPLYLNLDSTVIEFPQQYSIATNQVFYCAPDNQVGLTYLAGPGDSIIHTNSTVSSANKFYWGFASGSASSTAATYNLDSLNVQGAGNVYLQGNIAITGVAFDQCVPILSPGNEFHGCYFSRSSGSTGQGALTISGATQAALQANLDAVTETLFYNNTTTSGALRLKYTGSGSTTITLTEESLTFANNTRDIYWDAPSFTVLVYNQTSTANAATSLSTNSNTVIIQNIRVLTINNLIEGTKVRIYTQSAYTLLASADVVGASPSGLNNISVTNDPVNIGKFLITYNYSYTVDVDIYIVVFSLGYVALRLTSTLTNIGTTVQVSQAIDRQYLNPA